MANAIYPLWKQALMTEVDENKSLDMGAIDPVNGAYVSLVDIEDGYLYSDAHQFYSDINNVIGTPQLITNPIVAGRVFAGDSVVYTNVTGGANISIGAIIVARQNDGGPETWRLVLYEDTGVIGLPLIPSGGNLIVNWNTQGIFGL